MGSNKEVVYEAVKKIDDEEMFAISGQCYNNDQENVNSLSVEEEVRDPKRHLSKNIYRKLMLHILSSFLIVGAITAQINYVVYKFYLYSGHLTELLRMPWLMVLLFSECVYICSAMLSAVDLLLPPSSRADLGLFDTSQKNIPIVHIFIPACNEPTDIVVESLKAALSVDYPQDRFKVFVLDDGTDDDLRAFCNALQVETAGNVEYIRRENRKGVPHHFKCGNMNNGLKYSTAEYVVMMDSDMIIHPSYLRRVLPHIVNSLDVAFVQIPQSFYNLPIGDPLHDSNIMINNRMLFHRDSLGTASCIGTGVMFRHKHLDEIGGFQPQSITEDTNTAYVLLGYKGYESVYINEKLQIGLTPWTFEGYVKQRQRWGKGAIQQYYAHWRTCLGRGSKLNIVQKLLFFHHTSDYYLCFNNFLFMAVLLSTLTFNWKLFVGSEKENRLMIKNLALYLVISRIAWYSLWLNIPQGLMMRNRDESYFWWITPYFMEICIEMMLNFKASFVFVPTSNIDSEAVAAKNSNSKNCCSWLKEYTSQLKLVRFHLTFVVVTMTVVLARAYHTTIYGGCSEKFLVFALSFFLICTATHMWVPVAFILFPTSFKPEQRRSLIVFDADDIPRFKPKEDGIPKWSWAVIPYEILAILNLAFWLTVLVYISQNSSETSKPTSWCGKGYDH